MTSNTQIHDRSLSWLRIDTYAYIVTHRLLLWAQIGDTRHFEFHTGTKNVKFVEDHLMNIHVQFGFNHICSF